MLKSKNISDYFEAKLSDLKPGVPITFDIYLFFPRNRHIMLWRKEYESLNDQFIEKYRQRGIDTVWIHRDDTDKFQRYLNPPAEIDFETPEDAPAAEETPAEATPAPEPAPAPAEAKQEEKVEEIIPRTEQGAKMAAIMNMDDISEKKKAAMLAKEARNLLSQAADAQTMCEQVQATQQVKQVIHDVLDNTVTEAGSLVAEIWNLSEIDPDLEHAVTVATYVVIFAMAFGRIDETLIADLALAGLLHDVGISQVSADVTSIPWKTMDARSLEIYSHHVKIGLDLIETFAPHVPPRVRAIILQHHEKFDGTGYPQRLEGFRVDDVAQLLAIADVLDSIASGLWDGKQRTLKETLDTLESLEKVRAFPEFFNPEVFEAIMRWARTSDARNSAKTALKAVEDQSKNLMQLQEATRSAGLSVVPAGTPAGTRRDSA